MPVKKQAVGKEFPVKKRLLVSCTIMLMVGLAGQLQKSQSPEFLREPHGREAGSAGEKWLDLRRRRHFIRNDKPATWPI